MRTKWVSHWKWLESLRDHHFNVELLEPRGHTLDKKVKKTGPKINRSRIDYQGSQEGKEPSVRWKGTLDQ